MLLKSIPWLKEEENCFKTTTPMAVIVLVVLMFATAGGGGGGAPPPAAAPPPPAGDLDVQPEVVAEHEARWGAQLSAVEEEEDYGIWNPSPYLGGGGYGAPIPHAKEACCPHLPCCSIFNYT